MYKKSFLLALILSSCHLAPTFAQQRVEKIDVLEGQKTYKNYVKNPSAIKNTNGTSVSSATIARDTDAADKLDGIASFNCDASAQNGYCLWQVNTINEGDKTGNCEVSATFKGDASLYSLRLTDGTNTLYDLPLKNQTDWGGASFNYPCGATLDVRLVQTTAGTAPAVNIGRIYYGPATNLVNATADIYLGQIATTGSWTTNTTYTGHYWRVGDRLRAQVKVATTGAPTAASLTVNLPSGLSIDTSKGSYSYVDSPLGSASYYFTGSTSTKYFNGEALYNSATSVALIVGDHEASGGSNVPSLHRTTFTSSTFPFTFANGDYIIFNYEVPIVGWSSSSMAVQIDESLDMIGSVLAFAGSCPTNTLEANGATVSRATYSRLFAKIGTAHGSGDGSTTFHLPDYRGRFLRGIDGGTGRDPNAGSRTAMNSGGATGNNIGSIQDDAFQGHWHNIDIYHEYSAAGGVARSVTGHTNDGFTNQLSDVKQAISDGVNGTPRTSSESRPKNANVRFCVVYRGTNAPILVDENEMSVLYRHDSGQVLTSLGVIKFNVKVKDDFDSYNPATGVFTAPFAGTYEISYTLFSASATTSWEPHIRKNGTSLNRNRAIPSYSGGTSIINNQSTAISSPYIVYLTKGETLDVYLGQAASAGTLYTNALDSWLTIKRVGN